MRILAPLTASALLLAGLVTPAAQADICSSGQLAAGLPRGVGTEQSSSLPQLHTVPGRAGDLWLTAGDGALYHSTDAGAAFSKVGSVDTVATLGFGKAAPGAGYPGIYLTGIVGGVQGIFRSVDGGGSWLRINTGAQQWAWIGQTITGDPRLFGRV